VGVRDSKSEIQICPFLDLEWHLIVHRKYTAKSDPYFSSAHYLVLFYVAVVYILHDDDRTRDVVMFLSNDLAHILHTIRPRRRVCIFFFERFAFFFDDESIDVVHNRTRVR
jgi:hypothetical protein